MGGFEDFKNRRPLSCTLGSKPFHSDFSKSGGLCKNICINFISSLQR